MASVKIILRTDKKLKDGSHPIAIRIILERKMKYIHTGFKSYLEQWDTKTNLPNKKHANKMLANLLTKKKTEVEDIIIDLEREGKAFTLNDIEVKFRNAVEKRTIFIAFDERIKGLIKAGRIGNAQVYQDTRNALKNFWKKENVYFSDLDFSVLTRFEEYLLERGNAPNGIGVRMRTLRALYNYGINQNYVKAELYPFRNNFNRKGYNVSKFEKEPRRKALSEEQMDRIIKMDLDITSPLFDSWNLFLFSYYNMGMNFSDMALLKWKDIYGGRIHYNRSKTGKAYSIGIHPGIENILEKYRGHESKYVFPILKESHISPISIKNRLKKMLTRFNQDLKKIGEKLDLDIPLTSYVARHTWANILKSKKVPASLIQEGLGHRTEKTTRGYLDSFMKEELDEINRLLT